MSLTAIILVLISAVLHAFKNLFTKQSSNKSIFVSQWLFVEFLMFLPILIYYLISLEYDLSILILFTCISGIFHLLYSHFFALSYERGDLSQIYPVLRSAPALILIFAILFLGEEVTLRGASGVLIVLFGVYLISSDSYRFKEILFAFKNIKTNKSIHLAFLAVLSTTAFSIIDKAALSYDINPVFFLCCLTLFLAVTYTPYTYISYGKEAFYQSWKLDKKSIIISGFLSGFGYLLILIALTTDKVSYVTGLRQISVIFAILLAGKFLKENHLKQRLISASLIFIGAYLICSA